MIRKVFSLYKVFTGQWDISKLQVTLIFGKYFISAAVFYVNCKNRSLLSLIIAILQSDFVRVHVVQSSTLMELGHMVLAII